MPVPKGGFREDSRDLGCGRRFRRFVGKGRGGDGAAAEAGCITFLVSNVPKGGSGEQCWGSGEDGTWDIFGVEWVRRPQKSVNDENENYGMKRQVRCKTKIDFKMYQKGAVMRFMGQQRRRRSNFVPKGAVMSQ